MRVATVPGHVLLLAVALATDWFAVVGGPSPNSPFLLAFSAVVGYVGGVEALRWTATSSRWAAEAREGLSEAAALVAPRPWAGAGLRVCAGASLVLLGLLLFHHLTEDWWGEQVQFLFWFELIRLMPLGFATALVAPTLWLASLRPQDRLVAGLAQAAAVGSLVAAWLWFYPYLPAEDLLEEVLRTMRNLPGYLHGAMAGGTLWWVAERARD